MRVRRFLHFLLFTCVLLLLWQVVLTWSRTLPVSLSAPPRDLQEDAPSVFPAAPLPQVGEQLAEVIADKDLFSPTRRRASANSVRVETAVPPPSHLKLVGVFLVAGREEALFADSSQGGKVLRVRKGETVGAYQLTSITSTKATLAVGQNGEEVSLPLLILDSGAAAKTPHSLLAAARAPGRGRLGQIPPLPTPPRPGEPATALAQPTHNETQVIRQSIQQLQQRLRQIRRQAVQGSQGEPEAAPDEGNGEDEGNEDEE